MFDRSNKDLKNFEISLGLFVGYLVAGFINMLTFDKDWTEAYSDQKLLIGFVGIAISIFIILRTKRKVENKKS